MLNALGSVQRHVASLIKQLNDGFLSSGVLWNLNDDVMAYSSVVHFKI